MKDTHLGDSYHIVKRFRAESLRTIAPLHAYPRFIPADIRARYTSVTAIPILDLGRHHEGPIGLLLNSHTGVPLSFEPAA